MGRCAVGQILPLLVPATAMAAPIASSNFGCARTFRTTWGRSFASRHLARPSTATISGGRSQTNGLTYLHRIDANGTSYTASILGISSVADGETLHFTARGQVIYWIKNGVRDFIYNTGPDQG